MKKKVAILAPYVGSVNRGAETFVIELTKKLRKYYDINVYTTSDEKQISENIVRIDVRNSRLWIVHSWLYNKNVLYREIVNRFYYFIPDVMFQKQFTKRAFERINKEKYDMIFPNNGVWGCKYAKKYREKHSIPMIYTGHGGIGYGEKEILKCIPDAYVCLTKKHLKWAEKVKNEPTYILVIPNGVNVADFTYDKKQEGEKVVLSVGALTQFKRHELTIRAMRNVKDAKLIILGKGEELEKLKKIAERYIPNRYQITSVSYEEMKEQYKKANLFVLPSLEEPFGIVYLEAMSANIPVVAPDDAQRREIIGDAGFFCNVENDIEYAKLIEKALVMDWGNKPVDRAKLFDWDIISEEYRTLFEQVMDRHEVN